VSTVITGASNAAQFEEHDRLDVMPLLTPKSWSASTSSVLLDSGHERIAKSE